MVSFITLTTNPMTIYKNKFLFWGNITSSKKIIDPINKTIFSVP